MSGEKAVEGKISGGISLDIFLRLKTSALTLFGVVMTAFGLYLTFYLRFYPQRKLPLALRRFFSGASGKDRQKGISSFGASAAALAGTLGTGNIAGVAAALTAGGPGSVFWMWVSAIFGMSLKYAEIFLSVRFRKGKEGGPMYYIERAYGKNTLSYVFACGCVGASFGVGNMAQSNAAADSIEASLHLPVLFTGILMALAVGCVMLGGKDRIVSASERIIPLIGGIYLLGAAIVIIRYSGSLPAMFRLILQDAFTAHSAAGGVTGIFVSRAFRSGITRGIFTNEAGMGSAPIIHGSANNQSPSDEGLWGVAEVALDTLIMCTMTAAVLLLTGSLSTGLDGAELTVSAFSSVLGNGTGVFLGISTALFAFSSILTWSWCGESALSYLGAGEAGKWVYRILFLAAIVIGTSFPVQAVLSVSDLLNFYMSIPNLFAIFRLRKSIRTQTISDFSEKENKPSSFCCKT